SRRRATMKPPSKRLRARAWAGVVGLVAAACAHGEDRAIPVPPSLEALDAHLAARIQTEVADVRAQPAASERWLALGMTYEANELFGLAVECYRRALELASDAKGWHRLACAEAARGETAAAVEAMRRSIELEPGYAPSHWRLGSCIRSEEHTSELQS